MVKVNIWRWKRSSWALTFAKTNFPLRAKSFAAASKSGFSLAQSLHLTGEEWVLVCNLIFIGFQVLSPGKRSQHLNTIYPNIAGPTLQAPTKRSQHFNITCRNIVGRNVLRAFRHPVATCWTCWVLKIELVRMPRCNWPDDYNIMQHSLLLYSWRFSRYSASFHWLVHGHMTSNNETVSREMPRAGNIAKTMTSNGKQFTVTRSTVHCWLLLQVMAGISARFSNFAFEFCFAI